MSTQLIVHKKIEQKIFLIRGKKVMVDNDLAELYGVRTKELNKAVKRNSYRFPKDFMFQLTTSESESLRFQIGTSNDGRGGRRYLPFAFTEQGVAMLSSVLNSKRAVQVNIQIMRAFIKLKELTSNHRDISQKLEALERKYHNHNQKIKKIFQAIKNILEFPAQKFQEVPKVNGFISDNKK